MKVLTKYTFTFYAFTKILQHFDSMNEYYYFLGHKIYPNRNEYNQYIMKEFVFRYIERYIE